MTASDIFTQADFIAATGVSAETAQRFEAWRGLLETWNKRVNLVGAGTLGDFWRRHALDSAQVFLHLEAQERDRAHNAAWVDVGAGAGFPGLAIALLLEDRAQKQGRASSGQGAGAAPASQALARQSMSAAITLIESNGKKAAFLREVVRTLGLSARVFADRAEAAPAASADILTARAFAPLDRLCAHMHHLVKPGGVGVFLKGRQAHAEVEAARESWEFEADLTPSRASPDSFLVRIAALKPREDSRII